MEVSARRMTATDGWGYWTPIEGQTAWLTEQETAVPFPSSEMLPPDDANVAQLREALQRFGAALSYLYGRMGLLEGRAEAYDNVYKGALTAAKFHQEQELVAKKTPRASITEALKEQMALNDEADDLGEKLRECKRLSIETATLVITQKRIIDAYDILWRTVSRQLSGQLGEMNLESQR